MEGFHIDVELLSALHEASKEDLQALAKLYEDSANDEEVELYTYVCLLIFQQSHNVQRLEQAIQKAEGWLTVTAAGHPDYHRRRSILNTLENQYPAIKEDIEAVLTPVDLNREEPATNETDIQIRLRSEATRLVRRFQQSDRSEYLNKAIENMKQVISIAGESITPDVLNTFGSMLGMRYERMRSIDDLNQAVSVSWETLNIIPQDHPERATYLNNLGSMLGMRYKRTGLIDDLDQAVGVANEALNTVPPDHPDHATCLNNLGSMLGIRYQHTKSIDDLNQAVSITREAVSFIPFNHPDRAAYLSNLGSMLGIRYEHTESMDDLDQAISITREAIDIISPDHPDRAAYLISLGNWLDIRFKQTGSIDDLNEAINLTSKGKGYASGILRAAYEDWERTRGILIPQSGDDMESFISEAAAGDMGPGKYESGRGANSEDRQSMQLDTIESEAGKIEWDESSEDGGNTVEGTQSSTFDYDIRSRGTRPSTVPTSHPQIKGKTTLQVPVILEAGELKIADQEEAGSANPEDIHGSDPLAEAETEEQQPITDDSDVETTYSIDTLSDDPKLRYLQVFAEQLAEDMKQISDEFCFGNVEAGYLDPVLREFAWKLHGESSNPFQWEASVIMHRKRKNIIELLVPRPANHDAIGSQNGESSSSEDEGQDVLLSRTPFRKPRTTVMKWVDDIEASPHADEELDSSTEDYPVQDDILPQLPHYEEFIRDSDAYQWLLSKICQHGLLTFQEPNAMLEIGTKIRNQLRAQEPLRKMSSRKPPSMVKMTFYLDWNPVRFMNDAGFAPPYEEALETVVCLTGSWNEAQATTVRDYMDQTWPRSGHTLITLLQTLLSVPEGQECSYQAHESTSSKQKISIGAAHLPSKAPQLTARVQSSSSCCISVTGGPYFVSEISEQIGWLASALQSSSDHHGPVACTPSVNDIQVTIQEDGFYAPMVVGSCNLSLKLEIAETSEFSPGFCWGRLFCGPVLVRGYPILRRTQPNTGLEMSLANMAAIAGSQQVVRWGERIIIKGFNMLMIATLAAADIIVWHLLVSEQPEERISYIDSRLDTLDSEAFKEISLRSLEERRHVIGWCSKVTDLCGDATANLNIKSSGLREPPASIIIDRLYIETGVDFVAGVNMSFNKKEKPFWLVRENDYPSLLKWVGIQPIVFYDVIDRRAWLTDGASALLHLVRVSLYLDENDPESVYDWVFDATQFKDKWSGITGRQAALKTLTSWDNLNLNIYVVSKQRRSDGGFETEYATLETRVKKMLHSIEILIDKQAMSSSRDGIRISQTLDIRSDIIGFDIRDIIEPFSAIRSRITHVNSLGHGWVDLIPSIGTTTIFGRGFGDLISPKEPHALCSEWKSVPKGKDYMVASVATLQMLYERRLLRMEPSLSLGEMTGKIIWASPNHPFKSCECLQRSTSNTGDGGSHIDSVQFLIAKSSLRSRFVLRGSTPVDVMTLDDKGAVVFGHISILSRKSEGKFALEQQNEDLDAASSVGSSQGVLRPALASTAASESARSVGTTGATSPSLETTQSVGTQEESKSGENVRESDKKGKRWRGFMKFIKR